MGRELLIVFLMKKKLLQYALLKRPFCEILKMLFETTVLGIVGIVISMSLDKASRLDLLFPQAKLVQLSKKMKLLNSMGSDKR